MPITSKWDELSNTQPTFTCEELLLRNTFINSQMGPILQQNESINKNRPRAIKWVDNDQEATQGPLLVTSKSGDDLNLKEVVQPLDAHKKSVDAKKRAIKPFTLDLNALTGIQNFKDISKDPLQLPYYAIEISDANKNQ